MKSLAKSLKASLFEAWFGGSLYARSKDSSDTTDVTISTGLQVRPMLQLLNKT